MTKKQEQKVPALRFPEFSGQWNLERLGDFITPYVQRVPALTKLTIYSSSREGLKSQREYYDNREITNTGEYGVVPSGYFVYRHMSDDLTFKFNINNTGEPIAVSKEYPVFTTTELDSIFLRFKLNEGNDFKKFAITQKQGGTRTRLYFSKLSEWETLLPNYQEQQKLATFLSPVDTKVEQLGKKKTLLGQYKKGMMQKLFSQEIRFKDEQGNDYPDWKRMNLSDIAGFSKGKGVSKNDIADDGTTKCIRYGELYTHYGEIITEIQSRTNVSTDQLVLSQKNDVIIPASGETAIDIATASCVTLDSIALGGDLNIIRTGEDGAFLAYYLNAAKKFEIARLAQGISVTHLYASQLRTLKLVIPSIEEQQKIANFLSAIDQKIELACTEIEKVRSFKKGLLQQMFI